MSLFDSLRPHLARLIGNAVAWVCGWLLIKYGLHVSKETQELLVKILDLVLAYMVTRDTTHRFASKRINPVDAASTHLAHEGKLKREALRGDPWSRTPKR